MKKEGLYGTDNFGVIVTAATGNLKITQHTV